MASVRRAIVFLDWDTARRIAPADRFQTSDLKRAARQIEQVFSALQGIVASHLTALDPKSLFRVRWRLYHGWYSGKSKTFDYQAVSKFLQDASTIAIKNVSFGIDIEVATSMLIGGQRMPLYDTLRKLEEADGTKIARQKMVDTSLVCDLLQSSRSSRDDVHLVYGNDDDLLPGIFAAEAWGANIHMFRPAHGSKHLDTRRVVSVLEGI
ncbi:MULTISPECIES: hypothetical protein [unclassified Sphingomonas]|uniref:hypothetical protein n=1 Tax=unclassified Sphingomonas TaxID=196159 RepID=UPI00285EBEC3|nr:MULTISPECIES: hypothetical protein [unclassified Sphingomonas]MDR6115797.1 hypothetical protein [Sphingomonas sp. SORGH_AS_0789]MDR6150532.1 hypothetical protein [Sphingomonas sp. SORGH_AS_0742]